MSTDVSAGRVALTSFGPAAGTRAAPAPAPAARNRRPAVEAPLLFLVSAAVRAPSFVRPFWSPDEGYLATEATALRHGGRMYENVVDRKPPLVPWLYEACTALAGRHALDLVRVLAVVALAVTAVFTARLAARTLGEWAALPAGVLTVAASAALPAPDAMAATFEIFMLPSTVAAMYYGLNRRYLVAGLAIAVAALTKQVGLAPLLPLAVRVLAGDRRGREGAALAAGVTAPLVACALALGVRPFTFWVFLSSGSYASPPGAMAALDHAVAASADLLTVFAPFAPFALPAASAALRRRRGGGQPRTRKRHPGTGTPDAPRRRHSEAGTAGLWLLASAAGVTTGYHFYGHYFLQLVPAAALVAMHGVNAAFRDPGSPPRGTRHLVIRARRARTAAAAAGCALVIAAGWTGGALAGAPPEMDKSLALAAAVDAHSGPRQSVFLWGMHPEVYRLADRKAASRFLTAGLLTNFSGNGDPRRVGATYAVPGAWRAFRHELATAPPSLVVDDSAGTPYPLAGYPVLRDVLARHYEVVETVQGARIYRRTGSSRGWRRASGSLPPPVSGQSRSEGSGGP
ncbi:ArnT family glycosyltransferase [Streptomyces liangshanensis]|uniref:ArnT family glycosyltransferase n=1 Tax=Streptomyces liangshanensis TaxID=2717324 RepID=UPI0036DAA1EA